MFPLLSLENTYTGFIPLLIRGVVLTSKIQKNISLYKGRVKGQPLWFSLSDHWPKDGIPLLISLFPGGEVRQQIIQTQKKCLEFAMWLHIACLHQAVEKKINANRFLLFLLGPLRPNMSTWGTPEMLGASTHYPASLDKENDALHIMGAEEQINSGSGHNSYSICFLLILKEQLITDCFFL